MRSTSSNPVVRIASNAEMSVVAIDARTAEGRALMRECFGLSELDRAVIRRNAVVSQTERSHPQFGGIFAGRRVLPDAEVQAMDDHIARLRAPALERAA